MKMERKTSALVLITMLIDMCVANTVTEDLAQQLNNFAQGGLKVDEMQRYLDESSDFSFSSMTINGSESIQQAAELMRQKYQGRTQILQDLKEEIENTFGQVTSRNPYTNCRYVSGNEFDASLKQEVDYNNLCVAGNGLQRQPREFLPESLVESWKTTYLADPGLQYIYFGSEEGIIYNYPAINFDSPDYDPRFRPFYVEAVTPEPKDVVIVIDKSGSMRNRHGTRTLMAIAIEAAQTVVDTLNANDRVGLVAFSDQAETPSGCFSSELAMATSETKEHLQEYLSHVTHGGNTHYLRALQKAFDFFTNSEPVQNDGRNRTRVIIFLTDGEPTDSAGGTNILRLIGELNAPFGNDVTIFTFGLGNNLDIYARDLLQNMADQTLTDEENGEIRAGERVLVEDPDNLRSEMATYYDHFVDIAGVPSPAYTIPYQDAFGSGLISSMCLPVSVNTNGERTLKGVVCIDQTFGELLAELTYFQIGESSYSFMVDQYTRVLEHPNIANPTFVTDTPRFTYLQTLETGDRVDEMIASIRNGQDGDLESSSNTVVSRGHTDLDGVNVQRKSKHYYWAKVQGTEYTIGLAIIEGDTQANIQLQQIADHFFYHKLDLEDNVEKCAHFNTISVREESSVFFSLGAFQRPYEYFYDTETRNDLNAYKTYFTSLQATSSTFKDQIKEYVSATAHFHNLMQNNDYNDVSVWRYLATENGVYRNYPAVEIPKDWDAKLRRWYPQAKSNRNVLTLTAPYEDAFGSGTLLSLLHVLFEGKDQHDPNNDLVIGVMGMDFTPSFVYYMMTDNVPDCQTHKCFLMDGAGFIIVHYDWIESPSFSQDMYDVHISSKESEIAYNMISQNLMTYEACVNATGIRKQYFWKVSVNSHSSSFYDIHSIDGTNVFLVIIKSSPLSSTYCSACSGEYSYCGFLEPRSSIPCFCPCYASDTDFYDFCKGEFDLSSDTDPICTPPIPVVDFASVQKAAGNLERCYDYDCDSYNSMRDCNSVIGCNWCLFTESGNRVSDPYCGTVDVCPHGILASRNGGKGGGSDKESSGGGQWWIGVMCALIAVGVVVGASVVVTRKKLKAKKRAQQYAEATNISPSVAYNVSGATNEGYSGHTRDPPVNPSAPAFGHVNAPVTHAEAPPPYIAHQQHTRVDPGVEKGFMYP